MKYCTEMVAFIAAAKRRDTEPGHKKADMHYVLFTMFASSLHNLGAAMIRRRGAQ